MTRRLDAGRRPAVSMLMLLLLGLAPGPGLAATAWVTAGDDTGPGSFRQAVAAANEDPSIRRIDFARGLDVELGSAVVYTGTQDLILSGNGSRIAGSADAPPARRWDAGLFTSRSAAGITIRSLAFERSFNNGVAIFVPAEATGIVRVKLSDVVIEAARFHGLYVDGQNTDAYDTDGVPHPECSDPWPHDSAAGIALYVSHASIVANGTLSGGFDTGAEAEVAGEIVLTGCPSDFDGIRVDDGADGDVTAHVTHTDVLDNLADGVEYDERGDGSVWSFLGWSTIAGNGATGTEDLDDGFDIDEADAGSLLATFKGVSIMNNRDEGIDLDEEGEGSAIVTVVESDASANEDQGLKVDEANAGNLVAIVKNSRMNSSLSQDGIEFAEAEEGDLKAVLANVTATANDDAALAVEQQAPGAGRITSLGGDLTGNGDPSFDVTGAAVTAYGTSTD